MESMYYEHVDRPEEAMSPRDSIKTCFAKWSDWGDRADSVISEKTYFASEYFDQLYGYAVQLIKDGKAYVCELQPEEWENYRGVPEKPGKESPGRSRAPEENLELFKKIGRASCRERV